MSLQIWLPLDGRLDNFGLADVTIINSGATVDANGKIGKCYSFDGTDDRIYANNVSISTTSWSLASWVYPITSSSSGHQYLVGLNTSTYEDFTGVLCWYKNNFGVRIRGVTYQSSETLSLNNWYHVIATYGSNVLKLYVNGQLVKTQESPVTPVSASNLYLGVRGGNTGYFKGKLNDVRVYDHCLSPKQVKQISKGLVRHYPLNEIIGKPNLLKNTSFKQKHSQTNWNISKNGNQQPDNWGGYNSGVSNASTCYHAHLTQFGGEEVYEYILESETWLGTRQVNLQTILVPGTRYTFSIWQYIPQGSNNKLTINFNGYTENSNSAKSLIYLSCNSNIVYNKWQKFSFSTALPSNTDCTKQLNLYIYGNSGTGTVYMKRPKLEEGSEATPWVPNVNDAEYSSYDLGNVVYDCSGYGRNGSLSPTPPTYGSQSPRYFNCMAFNGTNNYIDCGMSNDGNLPTDAITVCGWVNSNNWSNDQRFISCTQNGGFNFQGHDFYAFIVYVNGNYLQASDSSISFTVSTWHFIAATFDGYSAKIYCDGQLKKESSKLSSKFPITYNNAVLALGAQPGGTVINSNYLNGKISDIRIYCTALSASDIKELYQSSLSIDNMGNFHTHEIFENTEAQS